MLNVKKHLDILGHKVTDRVTGFSGVASSVSFDLYGCVMVTVNPPQSSEKKLQEQHWFDIARLKKGLRSGPVMDRPDWEFGIVAEGRKGPAEKPAFTKV